MSISFNSFFVNSYPRSGNTWIRLLLIDALSARSLDLNPVFTTRFRIFNSHTFHPIHDQQHSGWIFKSHLMYDKIPQNLDMFNGIYLIRDGRDSLLSYYFYNVKHKNYNEPWDLFFKRYYASKKYNSYREKFLLSNMGSWAENVQSYINSKNTLIVKYEDLLKDPLKNTEVIFHHLKIPFENYKSNLEYLFEKSTKEMAQKKLRDKKERQRGSTGAWQDFFSESQNELFLDRSGEMLKMFGYLS